MHRLVATALAVLVASAACGSSPDSASPDDRPLVVAMTSILGGVIVEAFGDSLEVDVLIEGTLDPHSFHASPDQVARLRDADLVVANGLGLEEALADILESARDDGVRVIFLGDFIEPLPPAGDGPGDDPGALDPHFWLDPRRMAQTLEGLAEELADIDPARAVPWRDAAAAYRDRLLELDAEIRALLSPIPDTSRKLITNHDALRYFADAYGFTIVGTVIPGATTVAEPSASDLADLVALIRHEGIDAIFAETTRPARLAEVVAAEAGRNVEVVELYTGSLGEPGSAAATYPGYLRINAERILRALAP